MKINKRFFRFFSLWVVCFVFVCAVAPAALAAPSYIDSGFYIEPTKCSISSFEVRSGPSGDYYIAEISLSSDVEIFKDAHSILVWFDDYSFTCRLYRSDVDTSICFIGNRYITSSSYENTGESFFASFDIKNRSKCYMHLSADLFNSLCSNGSEGFVFAVQPITETGMSGSVSAGIHNSVHWFGKVVDAFISPDGAFSGLLPMFAIFIAVPALIVGFKVIKSLIWGA